MTNQNNSGILGKNSYKTDKTQVNTPDLSGNATIDGKEYKISGWFKIKNDKSYMSLSFRTKEEVEASKARKAEQDLMSSAEEVVNF